MAFDFHTSTASERGEKDLRMAVTFVLEDESTFCMEVGFFDSFQEIKEKIKNHKDITVERQTLKFEGKVLDDEESIFNTNISEASLVELIVIPPTTTQFTVKILEQKKKPLPVEMNLNDTVLQLKQKVYNAKYPLNFELVEMEMRTKSGEELQDHSSLRDCGMLNISHVYACKKRSPKPNYDRYFGKMVTIMVVPKGSTQRIPIEVNSRCCVGDLRFELEKFHRHALPENGHYYFTNNNTKHMMTETYTFDWHRIKDGDTIEITPAAM